MNAWMGSALEWSFRYMAGQFLKKAGRAGAVAQETLQQIIALNGGTVWGREHGLAGAGALEAFRRMPARTYADFAPYIERVANGEAGVLTGEPVTYFAVTSGTTGPQKLIPVTRRQTRTIMSTMLVPIGLSARAGLIGPVRGRYLQIMTEQVSGTTPGGIPKGAATSGGLRSMGKMMGLIWTSPFPVIQVQNQAAARYLHLLFALGEERLWSLVAFFPSTLLYTLRELQQRAPELLKDLADGTITPAIDLDPAVRAELTAMRRPDPGRSRHLARLLEQGRFTAKDIWPEAGVVYAAGSGAFRFYVEQLEPSLGGLPVLSPIYGSSEATVGIGLPDRPGYVIVPDAAYHEFLPLDGSDRPLSQAEVEEGGEYEVVLTNFAGLWRYRLGDQVRVVGRYGQAPIVEFLQRKGQVINMVGEKTGEAQISQAFIAACRSVGAAVTDYLVTPDPSTTPGRYLLLLEADHAVAPQLLEAFDAELRRTAPDYGDSVSMGEISPMGASVLRTGAFERYRERRIAAGASAAQVKVPHVVPDPAAAQRDFANEVVTAL